LDLNGDPGCSACSRDGATAWIITDVDGRELLNHGHDTVIDADVLPVLVGRFNSFDTLKERVAELERMDAKSRESGCWCDEHGHPCKACERHQEQAELIAELKEELDALKTLNILMSEMRNSAEREVVTLRTALEGLMLAYERRIRSNCTPEQLEQKPWRVAEYCIAEEALTNKEPLAKVEDGGNGD